MTRLHAFARHRALTRSLAGPTLAAAITLPAICMPAPESSPAGTVPNGGLVMDGATAMASPTYERRVQEVVNARRADHGLRGLRFATCPYRTAERWSRFLAVNHAFYHQSMTGVLKTCHARYAGETLGRGSMPPRTLVRMWMQSPPHRHILLSAKPRRIGVGATREAGGRWVVAANFVRY